MNRQQVLRAAIEEAQQAIDTLESWKDTLERGQKYGMVLSRDDMLGVVKYMEKAGLGSVGFLNSRFADDVFEAMTGERP